MDETGEPDLIEPEAAAELLGVSVRQLWRYRDRLEVVKQTELVPQERKTVRVSRGSVLKLKAAREGTATSDA